MSGLFGWCETGQCDRCPASYEPFYIDHRTKKPVRTGETRACSCHCHKEASTS